ncbi:MAG: metal-dependent hydrolase [Thermoproteota archaeon]
MIGPVHALIGYLVAYVTVEMLKSRGPRDGVLAAILGAAPDVDYVSPFPFGTPFGHHGVTHSPLLLTLVSVPFLAKYRWRAAPYFLALMSHIVADFIDNTAPLLSPFSWGEFGLRLSLSSSSMLLAHFLQLFITVASAYAIAKGWRSFPVSLPAKYDKLATPVLILLVSAVPFLPWLTYSDLQFFLSLSTEPYFAISVVLVLSSSILVLLILMLNSRFLAPRILSRLAGFLQY